AVAVGGQEAGGDRLHDVVVDDLQVGEVLALLLELALGEGGVLGQVGAEEGDAVEAEQVDGELVEQLEDRDLLDVEGGGEPAVVEPEQGDGVEQVGDVGHQHGGAAPQQRRRHADDDQVEHRERA